jgi:hypothetical protein
LGIPEIPISIPWADHKRADVGVKGFKRRNFGVLVQFCPAARQSKEEVMDLMSEMLSSMKCDSQTLATFE